MILYLHYCAIYPPQVDLQRDTKRAAVYYRCARLRRVAPRYAKKDPRRASRPRISLTCRGWRSIFDLQITARASSWHYFTFHLHDGVPEETPASKKTHFKHNINTGNIK